MHDTFVETIIGAVDVCNNCFRLVREERDVVLPEDRRSNSTVRESRWSRNQQCTTVEYAPADRVTQYKGVFCECGVEGPRGRVWDGNCVDIYRQLFDGESPDVSYDRFKQFVQNTIRTLESKGVSVDRKTFAYHALEARRDGKCVNDALSEGVTYAVAKAEASGRTRVTA